MLMRYQAALRSDRGGTYRTENHNSASLRFSYRKAGGNGIIKTARMCGVRVGTVARVKKELAQ